MKFLIYCVLALIVSVSGKGIGDTGSSSEFLEEFYNYELPDNTNLNRFDNFDLVDQSAVTDEELVGSDDTGAFEESDFDSVSYAVIDPFTRRTYYRLRRELIESDLNREIGHNYKLTSLQTSSNQIYQYSKREEIREGIADLSKYGPALHFNRGKKYIEQDKTFKMLKKFPKGCDLHSHIMGSIGADNLLRIIFSDPDLMMCFRELNGAKYLYFTKHRSDRDGCRRYYNVLETRAASGDTSKFDRKLRSYFVLNSAKPEYTSWGKLVEPRYTYVHIYLSIESICFQEFAYRQCISAAVKNTHDDKVSCVEYRHHLTSLKRSDGSETSLLETAKILRTILQEKEAEYGMMIRVIVTSLINLPKADLEKRVEVVNTLVERYPRTFIGWDFIGETFYGPTWKSHYQLLQKLSRKVKKFCTVGQTYFIHSNADLNCIDALLLNCARVGTAYSCNSHRSFWDAADKGDVVIELTLISDQMTSLHQNLMTHPNIYHLLNGHKVVLGSNMPGITQSSLSHEFYMASKITSAKSDGKMMVVLAANSIKYSSFSPSEKERLLEKLNEESNEFYKDLVENGV